MKTAPLMRSRRRRLALLVSQLLALHLLYDRRRLRMIKVINALVTLESGQRLIPRYFYNINDINKDGDGSSNDHDEKLPRYSSVWDLPRMEHWATQRKLSQHHIKTIYRVATSYRRSTKKTFDNTIYKPSSSELHNLISGDDDDSLERLALQQNLQEQGLPKIFAAELVQQFRLRTIRLHDIQYPSSSTGGSIKLVFQLPKAINGSDRFIETVIIRHDISKRNTDSCEVVAKSGVRYTVCVSSQVGCTRACTFCATGTQMKFLSQLSSSDIVEQVYMAQQVLNRIHPSKSKEQDLLRNIVFMGMGEPLDNWEAVYEACRTLTHQCIFQFNPKRITISTVGVSPNVIRQMARDAPSIRLAISLHGATQAIRERLMPATKGEHASFYELESALDDHIAITGQYCGPMIEYLLIDDVNDTEEAAQALIEFCQRRQRQQLDVANEIFKSASAIPMPTTYVNLIPYNPTLVGMNMYQYRTPADTKVITFHERLLLQNVKSHIRWSSAASRDTNGACGQLALLSSQLPIDSAVTKVMSSTGTPS